MTTHLRTWVHEECAPCDLAGVQKVIAREKAIAAAMEADRAWRIAAGINHATHPLIVGRPYA